ncbi:hypothetical protein N6H14_19115 [Paenibacillus sp. CC-CFT747]|nr:hypothetical protein N6H14_19115 [Paenibacillus sp. CC-CFT747]
MKREHAYLKLLEATADMQAHVAGILEAKVMEAEKTKHWLNRHVDHSGFQDHDGVSAFTLEFHTQLIEVIDGITKMERGLARNLKVLLETGKESEGGSSGGSSGGMFDFGGGDK